MQYTVTSLEWKEKGKVCLVLNERITLWLYRGELREFSLQTGSVFEEETYQKLLHEVLGRRATKRAMHLLERQDRTEYQLRQKLSQGQYPPEAIEDAISYVDSYHYLDDERYARTFISFHKDRRSRLRIRMDLQRRGIASEVIARCLEEEFDTDEMEQIMELLEKKQYVQNSQDQAARRKIYQFLLRRGFKSTDILRAMDKAVRST